MPVIEAELSRIARRPLVSGIRVWASILHPEITKMPLANERSLITCRLNSLSYSKLRVRQWHCSVATPSRMGATTLSSIDTAPGGASTSKDTCSRRRAHCRARVEAVEEHCSFVHGQRVDVWGPWCIDGPLFATSSRLEMFFVVADVTPTHIISQDKQDVWIRTC